MLGPARTRHGLSAALVAQVVIASATCDLGNIPYDPGPPGPQMPAGLQGTVLGPTRVRLTWIDGSSNERGFAVSRATARGQPAPIASVGANVTTYVDTGLAPATMYRYTVSAFNDQGSSSSASDSITTPATPEIVLSRTSLDLSATAGGLNPVGGTVEITNGGGWTLSGLGTSIGYDTATGWLTARLSSSTAPSTLSVQAFASDLGAGVHTATIAVNAADARNSPQSIEVQFTISSPPRSAAAGHLQTDRWIPRAAVGGLRFAR